MPESPKPPDTTAAPASPSLIRSIGPFQLTLYGLGSMLGSGIYGLLGQAAGQVGNAVWASFVVAMVAALLTALSYASLGSRYPLAGGAAFVTQKAYGMPLLSFVVGLAVVCSGLASVATQSQVFALNLTVLLPPGALAVWTIGLGFLLTMSALVLRGIRESMWVNVAFTLIEAGGLLLVIAVGIPYWGTVDLLDMPGAPGGGATTLLVMQGAVLTFFAFIGFEDTLNVAEECRDPQRTVPIALVTAMAVGALIYVAVAISAVSVVPWRELSRAPGPLTEVMARAAPAISPWVFTAVTLFAVANTALVNYVTSSRLVYGMAQQGLLPRVLGNVHQRTRTPHVAALLLLAILLPLGLLGSVANLASAAVLLLLAVFAVVNGALFVLKGRASEPAGRFEIPRWIPAAGTVICLVLVGMRVASSDWHAPALAGGLLAGILALYALLRAPGLRRAGLISIAIVLVAMVVPGCASTVRLDVPRVPSQAFDQPNLGDAYFNVSPDRDFADLDVLAAGPVVADMGRSFDRYWNSEAAVPIASLTGPPRAAAELQEAVDYMAARALHFRRSEYVVALRRSAFGALVRTGQAPMVAATAQLLDALPPGAGRAESAIFRELQRSIEGAQSEVILVSPYLVPGPLGVQVLCGVARRGVRVRVLTNSLSSTDVPLVHAGYARYRPELLACGVTLYELRPGGAGDRAPRLGLSSGASLHSKAVIVDGEAVFIGSMNLDPRSRLLNTEVALLAHSLELGGQLRGLFDEAVTPTQAFRVDLDQAGNAGASLHWDAVENGKPVRFTREPLASEWRRWFVRLLGALAPEEFL